MKLITFLACIATASALAPLWGAEYVNKLEGRYIVVYKDEHTFAEGDEHLAGLGIEHLYRYQTVLNGWAAELDDESVAQLRADPMVKYIEHDQKVWALAGCAGGTCISPYEAGSWGQGRIAEAVPSVGEDDYYSYPSGSNGGSGVTAYILDTGIYIENVDFEGRASFGWKASTSWSNTDKNGHGTHVASTVGGKKYGVAPKTRLVAVKVLGDDGSGSTAGVIAGVDYVASQAQNDPNSVANMSLGGGYSVSMNNAVNSAMAFVTMVVAAGNDDADAAYSSPASADAVITVGSTTLVPDNQGLPGAQKDQRSSFSNYGRDVDIFAPGSAITAAWVGSPKAIATISGTSMASPHVCGVAALHVAVSSKDTPQQIKQTILQSGEPNLIDLNCRSTSCSQSPNIMLNNCCDNSS